MGARKRVREAVLQVYEYRLARALAEADLPRHVGVIMDGNRRWARSIGLEDVAHGHRRGAEKILDLLALLEDRGDRLIARGLQYGSVSLHPDLLVLRGKGAHAPRLRNRRLRVIPNGL